MTRSALVALTLLSAIACQNPADPTDDGSGPVDPPDTDTPDPDTDTPGPDPDTTPGGESGDTGTAAAYPKPSQLTVDCATTGNALRFLCTVEVDPPQPVQVTWSRSDGLGPTRTLVSEEVLGLHEIVVYYMGPDKDYDISAAATTWPTDPVAADLVHTGVPPQDVLSYIKMTGATAMGLIGTNVPCGSDAVATIYDTSTGELVWYHELDPGGNFGLVDMVSFTDDMTVIGETNGKIVEVDLEGRTLLEFTEGQEFDYDLHHDIFKWNDQVYVLHQISQGGLTLDGVLVLDANTGAEVAHFLPQEHFDVPGNANGDYLHTNTVFVDDAGDIYLSWLAQETLVKIVGDVASPDFGEPIWILESSPSGGFVGDIVTDWSFIGGDNGFGFQHNLSVREDGRLQVLDNTNGRALVFTLDEVAKTATVDGAFDAESGSCGPQGTAMDTVTGNVVVGCAGDNLREYDILTGQVVWEADFECANGDDGGFFGSGGVRYYPLDTWDTP